MVGMLHFTPDQARAMSLKEIKAAIDGFEEFNGGGRERDLPTMDEVDEMMRLYPDT
jgi:hypothetical protein